MTLSKFHTSSVPQFPCLQNGDGTCRIRERKSELTCVQRLKYHGATVRTHCSLLWFSSLSVVSGTVVHMRAHTHFNNCDANSRPATKSSELSQVPGQGEGPVCPNSSSKEPEQPRDGPGIGFRHQSRRRPCPTSRSCLWDKAAMSEDTLSSGPALGGHYTHRAREHQPRLWHSPFPAPWEGKPVSTSIRQSHSLA